MKPLSRPTAKTGCNLRLHTIAQGDNHVKIVMVNITSHLTIAFLTN